MERVEAQFVATANDKMKRNLRIMRKDTFNSKFRKTHKKKE